MRNNLFLGAAAIALIAPMAASAQETTSSIRGTVSANGAPVAGATVVILNVPSGSRSTQTTDASGNFNAGGLRVGGPFTVTVTAAGYPETSITDIQTTVAQSYELPIELAAAVDGGDDIVVTASSLPRARNVSQGPATVLNAEQIGSVASLNRDVRDLMRRDPFARLDDSPTGGRAVSFAGQNARFNRFSVDGVPVTDNFGLNPDGLPTRRSPIPFDAIGQFQTKVAPYDVREGNFQGGAINAILKSGTNEFHGTGFYAYSDDGLTGKRTKAGPGVPTGRVNIPDFKYENFGAQLSGPIIKDKLFFMIAGERIRANTPIVEGTAGTNAGTVVPNITDTQVAEIQRIAQARYGYDTGGILQDSNDRDDRLVARFDANLSDTQRASVTYMYTKDSIQIGQNTFVTGTPGLGLESNGYISSNRLHTGVAQLNSDWTDEFSTEIRGFYKDYKRGQDPIMGRGFAQMQVCTAPTSDRSGGLGTANDLSTACQSGFGNVSFGPDISRQVNQLTSRTYGGLVQGRLTRDDHDLRVFAEFSDSKIYNAFLQQSSASPDGNYYFDSLADFAAGNAQRLRYANAVPSLDPVNAAARFRYQSYTFGVQDTWRVTDILTLSYGARYDLFGGDSRPELNSAFLGRYNFPNTAYISGRGVFQPRVGFDFKPASALSFRGGIGIFSGGSPDVYVSNSFSNTGFLTNAVDIRQNNNNSYLVPGFTGAAGNTTGAAILTNVNGETIPAQANAVLTNASVSQLSPTNALDPNFKVPSQWRGTLSADFDPNWGGTFGNGWHFGADFLWSDVRNQVFFTDLRVAPTALRTPDGRVRYASLTSFGDTNSDLFLTNTTRGRSYIGVARVNKDFDFGLNVGVSYSYQNIKDQAPATSSTASSNYGNGGFLDANGAAYGISNDQVKHNLKYNVSFNHAFFGDYKTNFTLFGETRIGRPYSYTMQEVSTGRSSVFGTIGNASRYLLYVPTSTTDALVSYGDTVVNGVVTQTAAQTQANLDTLINSTGLAKYRGKIAPRNGFNSKWFTRFDLHIGQEIPTFVGKSRIELFADIENITNFLNKNWGQVREYQFPYTIPAVRVQCVQAPTANGATPAAALTANTSQGCAQYRYTAPSTAPSDTIYARQSLYSIRVGARFSF
ncbi:TonB-dependent receptor [Sphingomonas sp. STIS6.2]|uniref:TonB-dependent receptor n=1 Tax=Sphingomonas sp. STIS6.2 TaxID=1379700 RepID=UPI000D140E25|nr:TonB-dependent receptor [Sphingomonas sp. STIS6.2]